MHAFMGPLPKCMKKPKMVQDFFPTYPDYEPLVFIDKSFNFNFFKNWVFCFSPPTEDGEY